MKIQQEIELDLWDSALLFLYKGHFSEIHPLCKTIFDQRSALMIDIWSKYCNKSLDYNIASNQVFYRLFAICDKLVTIPETLIVESYSPRKMFFNIMGKKEQARFDQNIIELDLSRLVFSYLKKCILECKIIDNKTNKPLFKYVEKEDIIKEIWPDYWDCSGRLIGEE